jgi:hypothetical protein
MGQYKQANQPLWDSEDNNQPLWQPQRSGELDANSNLFEEHYDDPNDPYAAHKRKKKAEKQDDKSNSSNNTQPKKKTKLEESATDLFGIPQSQLEQLIGSAHSSKETKADDIAKAATTEPITPEADKTDQTKPSASEPDHTIPGLPKQGGTALPKDKKAQFERKVSNLENIPAHQPSKHPRAFTENDFTIGRHPDLGETMSGSRKTKRIRKQAPDNSWVTKHATARAAEKERQLKALEAENKRLAKLEADRKIAEAKHAAEVAALKKDQDAKSYRIAVIAQMEHDNLVAKQRKQDKKDTPQPQRIPPRQKTDLSGLMEQARLRKEQREQQKQAKLQALLEQHPGIRDILKQPPSYFSGAMALGAAVMNPALSASLVAGSMAWPALAADPKVSRRLLNGAETRGTQSFQGTTQLAQASQSAHQGKADPIASFQQNLKRNAQTVLQQNRTRLDQSQQRFSNPDPQNPNWAALRQQGTAVAALNYKTETAKLKLLDLYRKATSDRVSSPFPILDTETSPEARRAMMLGFFQRQLGPSWKTLAPQMQPWVEQFYVADTLRTGLFAKEPALAVLTVSDLQQSNTPDHNRQLQQQIAGGFNTTRESIGKLEKGLKNDKDGSLALKFDTVASQTIANIKDPKQRQQVLKWVQAKQKAERDQQLQGAVGLAATTVGAIASYAFGAGILASIFGGTGFVLSGKMSLDGINQAGTNLDAVQAGDAGGQRLTAMNPHQAQMDYQMAMVNVGLSLLDAGVAVSSIRQVLGSRQAVQALTKLKPNQVEQFAKATRLQQAGKTAEAKKALQHLESEVDKETFKELKRAQTGAGFSAESANAAYKAIRESTTDVASIARNTGIKASSIQKVKDHLFYQEHLLDRYTDLGIPAEMRRFDSDQGIAKAWQRLESGKYTQSDLQLLRHEAAEAYLMRKWNDQSYTRAHNRAEQRFPAPPLNETGE